MADATIRNKFHERAIFLYACQQIAEGIPATKSRLTGKCTMTVSGTTATVTGIGTEFLTEVPVGIYLVASSAPGKILGRVSTVSDNNTLTLSDVPTGVTSITTSGGVAMTTRMGPKNRIAALNMNFGIELTSEAFQYTGDELDRDEITVITDVTGKCDFETFMPIVSTATSANSLYFKPFFNACGMDISSVTTAPASGAKGYGVPVPHLQVSNSDVPSVDEQYISVEIHRSSQDLPNHDKIYPLTDVRGTVDLDSVIGTKVKLKWNLMGNLNLDKIVDMLVVKDEDLSYVEDMKTSIGQTVQTTNLETAKISNLNGYVHTIGFPATWDLTGDAKIQEVSILGLNFNPGTNQYIVGSIAYYYAAASALLSENPSITLADLNESLGLTLALTGEFTSKALDAKYSLVLNTAKRITAQYRDPTAPATIKDKVSRVYGLRAIPVKGSAGSTSVTARTKNSAATPVYTNLDVTTSSMSSTYGVLRNICFDKMSLPNLAGWEFSRYKTGCLDGWSKGAVASDVSITVIEDSAGAAFNPYKGIEDTYGFWFGYTTGTAKVILEIEKMQLTNVTNSSVAAFSGQDLTFRNRGKTTLYFVPAS